MKKKLSYKYYFCLLYTDNDTKNNVTYDDLTLHDTDLEIPDV